MSSYHEIVYLLTSVFSVYTIYKFMRLFFEKRVTNRWIELGSYSAYFMIITFMYFKVNIPMVLLVTNILSFFGIAHNYKATLKERLMSTLYIFLMLMAVEVIIGSMTGYFGVSVFESTEYQNNFALISVTVISYMLVLLLENFKHVRKGNRILTSNWFAVIGIPILSLFLIILVFQSSALMTIQVVLAIASLLVINIFVFHLFDTIQLQAEKEIERKLLQQQNIYYTNQFELMKSTEQSLRAIRHDWKNHISVLSSLMDKGDYGKAMKYLVDFEKASKGDVSLVDTGNLDFDSILNFKLREATQRNIKVNCEISIPEKLNITTYDLTTILGNSLDNAIEAAILIKNDAQINLKIKFDKGRLLIELENPYLGEIQMAKGLPVTKKENKQEHGIGLKQIKKTLEKYNGELDLQTKDQQFQLFMMLYLEA